MCMEGSRPHVVTPEEKRRIVTAFSACYQYATPHGRHELPAAEPTPPINAHALFWCSLYRACASHQRCQPPGAVCDVDPNALDRISAWETSLATGVEARQVPEPERRQFLACAFCAMQYWNDELTREYIAGPNSFMRNPANVAELLSADWYKEQWP